jgi:NAD kinase
MVDYKNRIDRITNILKELNKGEYMTYKRSRSKITLGQKEKITRPEPILCLNEAFCAEKDVGSASRFRIAPDDQDWGIFKSSGLIVSTGTGSTGWLFSSRQVTASQLGEI